VTVDLAALFGIVPCGITDGTVTSMQLEWGERDWPRCRACSPAISLALMPGFYTADYTDSDTGSWPRQESGLNHRGQSVAIPWFPFSYAPTQTMAPFASASGRHFGYPGRQTAGGRTTKRNPVCQKARPMPQHRELLVAAWNRDGDAPRGNIARAPEFCSIQTGRPTGTTRETGARVPTRGQDGGQELARNTLRRARRLERTAAPAVWAEPIRATQVPQPAVRPSRLSCSIQGPGSNQVGT